MSVNFCLLGRILQQQSVFLKPVEYRNGERRGERWELDRYEEQLQWSCIVPGLVLSPGIYISPCSSTWKKKQKKNDLCALAITLKLKSIPGSAWLLWQETTFNSSQVGAMKGCRHYGRIWFKTQGHKGGHENLRLCGGQKGFLSRSETWPEY